MKIKQLFFAAIAMWICEKCPASVMVAQFGAKGDGFTDDAPAFQAAINSGQEVHIPRGIYSLRSRIVLGPGSTLIGENNPTLRVGPGHTFDIYSSYDWLTVSGFV